MRVISGSARGRPLARQRGHPADRGPDQGRDLLDARSAGLQARLRARRGRQLRRGAGLAARARPVRWLGRAGHRGAEPRRAASPSSSSRIATAARIIEANLRATGLDERARVHQSPVDSCCPACTVRSTWSLPIRRTRTRARLTQTLDALAHLRLLLAERASWCSNNPPTDEPPERGRPAAAGQYAAPRPHANQSATPPT